MNYPIHIRFAGLEPSNALATAAEVQAYKLPWAESEIMVCWIGMHCDPEYAEAGGPYSVRVDVSLPGYELVSRRIQHQDMHLAMGYAFEDMARQLRAIDPQINHAEFAVTVNGLLLPPPAHGPARQNH
ncbi:MAG: hypothetical protein V4627_20405 [Pseudomonadota bacterium]